MNKKEFILGILMLESLGMMLHEDHTGSVKPTVFEPNNLSTDAVEFCPSLSSDGTEIYFAKSDDKWGVGEMKSFIYYATKQDNQWSKPQLASFSGHYDDSDPHLAADGKSLYFVSKRSSDTKESSADIWIVNRDKKSDWGTPVRLAEPINSSANEYSPCTDKKGNLYFASGRMGGYGQGDLYRVEKRKGKFGVPTNLGDVINSDKGEWNLEINAEGDLLIFEASQRAENLSAYGDLYLSFRLNNHWTVPQNMVELNTTGSDLYPHLADHEKTLFYTSSDSLKSRNTDIYFVEFKSLYKKYLETAIVSKN